jgi:hypothetical protein
MPGNSSVSSMKLLSLPALRFGLIASWARAKPALFPDRAFAAFDASSQ